MVFTTFSLNFSPFSTSFVKLKAQSIELLSQTAGFLFCFIISLLLAASSPYFCVLFCPRLFLVKLNNIICICIMYNVYIGMYYRISIYKFMEDTVM